MSTAPEKNLRVQHRRRVLKRATILQEISDAEISCIIRDMHCNGARIILPECIRLPQEFRLYIPLDRICYECNLKWIQANQAGVVFARVTEKPKWHYG